MSVLAFDTATRATTVALAAEGGELIEARDDPAPGERPRHTTLLMKLVTDVLERSGSGWEGVDRIAVGVGPGTFTGLRIGIATARALARARAIDLAGVSTLESLALGAADNAARAGRDAVLAVIDARRGEVFAAAWTVSELARSGPRESLLAPAAFAPEALAERAARAGQKTLAVGDGALAFRGVLAGPATEIPHERSTVHLVHAAYHCRLGRDAEPAAGGDVRPEYLRLPDAEISYRASHQR